MTVKYLERWLPTHRNSCSPFWETERWDIWTAVGCPDNGERPSPQKVQRLDTGHTECSSTRSVLSWEDERSSNRRWSCSTWKLCSNTIFYMWHIGYNFLFLTLYQQRFVCCIVKLCRAYRPTTILLLLLLLLGVIIHRCRHGKAPQYLVECCTPVTDVVGRQRRRSSTQQPMVVPRHRLSTVGCRAFAVYGPMVWNSLPDDGDLRETGPENLAFLLILACSVH